MWTKPKSNAVTSNANPALASALQSITVHEQTWLWLVVCHTGTCMTSSVLEHCGDLVSRVPNDLKAQAQIRF